MLLITGGDVPRNEVNERNQGCQGENSPEGGEILGAGKLRIGRYDAPNIDFHVFLMEKIGLKQKILNISDTFEVFFCRKFVHLKKLSELGAGAGCDGAK